MSDERTFAAMPRKETISLKGAMYAAGALILFFIFSTAQRFGIACAFGLCAAATYFNKKYILNALLLCIAALVVQWGMEIFYSAVLPIAVTSLAFFILDSVKKQYSPLTYALIAALSRLFLLLGGGTGEIAAGYVIDAALSGLFFLLCVNAFKAPLMRGLKLKLTVDELVCFAAVILALYAGLYNINFFGVKTYLAIAAFSILLCLSVYSLSAALAYGLVIGAAISLLSANPAYLGVYAVYALIAGIFKDTSRYLSAVSIILTDLLLAYFFKIYISYSYLDIIMLAAGCVLYLIMGKNNIDRLKMHMGSAMQRQLSRHIVNRTRTELNLKLVKVSEVFYEMERIFSGMVKGYMQPQEAVDMLCGEAMEEVCGNCPEFVKCIKHYRTEAEKGYKNAITAGIDRGRITLLDIPPELASVCGKANSVLSVCSRLANSYRQYAIVVNNLDTSRALIGRQFKGVGDILKQLAKETKNSVGFDTKTERVIMDELAFNNIVCAEAAVYNENNRDTQISLLVRQNSSHDKAISRIISGLISRRMVISGREDSRREGFSVLHLKPAPKFDVVFGAAGCAKAGKAISGDTHSLTRIADDKFLIALCDGMGSGENAEKISSTAISMVENFYRAGFDSETILSGVNRLLNVGNEDNFAALDICALDLTQGVCDFIKLGAPEGYIKGAKHTDIINSGALPMGILEDLRPSINTKQLQFGDMIVLISDGISDAFGDKERLKEFIFSEHTQNPQELAESVLKKALALSGGVANDDMTALTMRVFTPL